jgi:hypothetical protein
MSYNKQELLTFREHLVGSVLLIFLFIFFCFLLSYYVSYVVYSVLWCTLLFPHKRCLVRLCLQLFVGGIMSCLRLFCICLCVVVSGSCCVVFLFCFSSSCLPYVASLSGLPIFDCPFGVPWHLLFNILVTYTVNHEHNVNFNFACLWVENKPSMSIVYRESRTSSEWSNGMTYIIVYTYVISWSTDEDLMRLNKEKITQAWTIHWRKIKVYFF